MTPIVDTHQHVWRRADLAWLHGPPAPRIFGKHEALRRDYPMEEYLGEARPAGVVRSVYVQTNWPAGREVDEVDWVQSVAERHGFPHAVVGYADRGGPDVGPVLDQMMKRSRLRRIRQQLHWRAGLREQLSDRDAVDDLRGGGGGHHRVPGRPAGGRASRRAARHRRARVSPGSVI